PHHEGRHQTLGIDGKVFGFALTAGGRTQVHVHGLALDPFQVDGDADTVGSRASEVAVELHSAAPVQAATIVIRSVSSPSTPHSTRSAGRSGPTPAGVPV